MRRRRVRCRGSVAVFCFALMRAIGWSAHRYNELCRLQSSQEGELRSASPTRILQSLETPALGPLPPVSRKPPLLHLGKGTLEVEKGEDPSAAQKPTGLVRGSSDLAS